MFLVYPLLVVILVEEAQTLASMIRKYSRICAKIQVNLFGSDVPILESNGVPLPIVEF